VWDHVSLQKSLNGGFRLGYKFLVSPYIGRDMVGMQFKNNQIYILCK